LIDPSRFVYVSYYGHDELIDIIRDELVLHGFGEKQIIFEKPAKFAQVGDYFAVYMPNTKILSVDRVGKAKTLSYGEMSTGDFVQSDKFIFSVDLSKRIRTK